MGASDAICLATTVASDSLRRAALGVGAGDSNADMLLIGAPKDALKVCPSRVGSSCSLHPLVEVR